MKEQSLSVNGLHLSAEQVQRIKDAVVRDSLNSGKISEFVLTVQYTLAMLQKDFNITKKEVPRD